MAVSNRAIPHPPSLNLPPLPPPKPQLIPKINMRLTRFRLSNICIPSINTSWITLKSYKNHAPILIKRNLVYSLYYCLFIFENPWERSNYRRYTSIKHIFINIWLNYISMHGKFLWILIQLYKKLITKINYFSRTGTNLRSKKIQEIKPNPIILLKFLHRYDIIKYYVTTWC
jgi:hypothetical protein